MKKENYKITQYSVNSILADVQNDKIAIPQMQRPFVWKDKQVKDLIDSLYRGYPIGYLIVWQNSEVKIRFGRQASGKKILIDGQQRITALMSSVLGKEVLDDAYHTRKIQIAFHPFAEDESEQFEVWNEKMREDTRWIPDISVMFQRGFSYRQFEQNYIKENKAAGFDIDTRQLDQKITQLKNIVTNDVGVIELSFLIDIDIVTEIFLRINTQGKALTQEDFAMSKIAVFEDEKGDSLRKTIDYFCHLCYEPTFLRVLQDGEQQFVQSVYGQKIVWTGQVSQTYYVPSYADLLKSVCLVEFGKGKIGELVHILSGKDGKKKTANMELAKKGFETLQEGVFAYVEEENFVSFLEAIKECGFASEKLLPSQATLNYLYAFYLKVRKVTSWDKTKTKAFFKRWFVMSLLTQRYQTTAETTIGKDMQQIEQVDPMELLEQIEKKQLSQKFFETTLKGKLKTTGTRSIHYSLYVASLVATNTKALYSKDKTVRQLIEEKNEKSVLFSKSYLQKNDAKGDVNDIANFVFFDKEVKAQLKRKAPGEYMEMLLSCCENEQPIGDEILTKEELTKSIKEHAIPPTTFEMWPSQFALWCEARRTLIAKKIEEYYRGL